MLRYLNSVHASTAHPLLTTTVLLKYTPTSTPMQAPWNQRWQLSQCIKLGLNLMCSLIIICIATSYWHRIVQKLNWCYIGVLCSVAGHLHVRTGSGVAYLRSGFVLIEHTWDIRKCPYVRGYTVYNSYRDQNINCEEYYGTGYNIVVKMSAYWTSYWNHLDILYSATVSCSGWKYLSPHTLHETICDNNHTFIIRHLAHTVDIFQYSVILLLRCTGNLSISPRSKHFIRCCLIPLVSHTAVAGSHPAANSVAYAKAYTPQSSRFSCAINFIKSMVSVAFGLVIQQITFFVARSREGDCILSYTCTVLGFVQLSPTTFDITIQWFLLCTIWINLSWNWIGLNVSFLKFWVFCNPGNCFINCCPMLIMLSVSHAEDSNNILITPK